MSDGAELIITARELIQCGMCARGQMRWFREQGLNFSEHLKNGTRADLLLATNDGLAIKAVNMVRERRGQ